MSLKNILQPTIFALGLSSSIANSQPLVGSTAPIAAPQNRQSESQPSAKPSLSLPLSRHQIQEVKCAKRFPNQRIKDLINAIVESPNAHPVTSSLFIYIRDHIQVSNYSICKTDFGPYSHLAGLTLPEKKQIFINQTSSSFLVDITVLHELAHVGFHEFLKSGAYNPTNDPDLAADQINFDTYYQNAADEVIAQLVTSDSINILSQGFADFLFENMQRIHPDHRHSWRLEIFTMFQRRLEIPASEMPQFINSVRLLGELRQLVQGDIKTFKADPSIIHSLQSSFHFSSKRPVQFVFDGQHMLPTILDRKADRIELRLE